MNICILHLSDLHINTKNGSYSEVLGNLINDIKDQCSNLKRIILVITGDIIDQAHFSNDNYEITIKFFKDLQLAIGNKIVGIEFTPGNHDKERQEINSELINKERNKDEISNITDTDWEYFLIPYKKYLQLINEIRLLFNKNSVNIKNTYYVEAIDEKDFKIIFINLDTSWSSYGGNADKRNLCIDEKQLNNLKESYQKEKREDNKKIITIMTAHHPLNWLKEKDESYISSWLLNTEYFNIDFYLCGHTHDRQIKSLFDTYKSYITLVTGIGWDEKTPEEERNKHRYSIYILDTINDSCEIIVRKTQTNGIFDYDNDILLSDDEKIDKRIFMSFSSPNIKPKIKIPKFINNHIQNEYLFVDKKILEQVKLISIIFYEVSNHMALFQSMHIRDFFVKYELNKTSKGTIEKQELYDDYFYKNKDDRNIVSLFDKINNNSIIYKNFISYLRELCGTLASELKEKFDEIVKVRVHFRKFFKTETDNELYIAFCQATEENNFPPAIRDISYDNSIIKILFENGTPLVFIHNKKLNPLSMEKSIYKDFITMAPNITKNTYVTRKNQKDVTRPYLTSSLSITFSSNSNLLDILNFFGIEDFIFKLVYNYVSLFKINMEKFIDFEEVLDN